MNSHFPILLLQREERMKLAAFQTRTFVRSTGAASWGSALPSSWRWEATGNQAVVWVTVYFPPHSGAVISNRERKILCPFGHCPLAAQKAALKDSCRDSFGFCCPARRFSVPFVILWQKWRAALWKAGEQLFVAAHFELARSQCCDKNDTRTSVRWWGPSSSRSFVSTSPAYVMCMDFVKVIHESQPLNYKPTERWKQSSNRK